ncbi:hypothetical protein NB640_11810 [Oxalobacter vibrioformis]|uniref:Uncharacterized protein n=1 Tax=Oxalobacter vibrioformis TaxID=933080 RepID=A0A9E9LZ31_9BURK|nr:hypothetical protein [Oxalobacter vibrioformis]NLC23784.1 hypothetical protein [Oxalobacter sp.]WAW09888.1 hypothetical protein NB640_11810 [Oxalobacter vibrioformis]
MNEIIPYLLQAIGALLALLTMILAWFGSRIQTQLDEIKQGLIEAERETREEVTQLDMRMTRLETRCAFVHPVQKGAA